MSEKAITVELDTETAESVKHLAEAWGISPEQALKRALKSADATASGATKEARRAAFLELSRSLNLGGSEAQAWMDLIRDARR